MRLFIPEEKTMDDPLEPKAAARTIFYAIMKKRQEFNVKYRYWPRYVILSPYMISLLEAFLSEVCHIVYINDRKEIAGLIICESPRIEKIEDLEVY